MPPRVAIGGGVYQDPVTGAYYARPWINRRRTWRRLAAVKPREAIREAATTPWAGTGKHFSALAQLYIDARCPNKKLESRSPVFCQPETARAKKLIEFYGRFTAEEITLATIPRYRVWRVRQLKANPEAGRTGDRTVDKDLVTLSNILSYGCAQGLITTNHVRTGRPKYRTASAVRHSREVAPASAAVIHQIADSLFSDLRSEVLGWQLLFAAFTGCRTSELLRLRVDAADPAQPGHYQPAGEGSQPGLLSLGRRSKGGVNPWAMVGPEFAAMLQHFFAWHRKRHPRATHYFPSPLRASAPVNLGALGHALARQCRALDLPHITPHGLRSWYVTKRRSDGVTDTVIAGEIGDQTVALMQTTYGARPANWTGGEALSWLPAGRLPAWIIWAPAHTKIIRLPKTGGAKP
jgi:integrase